MSINRDAVRNAIMAVVNEDYYGLYEVVWYLRANHMRTASESELIQLARDIVRSLLDDGSATLVQFTMKPQAVRAIDPVDNERVLAEDQSWRPPPSWDRPYPSLDAAAGGLERVRAVQDDPAGEESIAHS